MTTKLLTLALFVAALGLAGCSGSAEPTKLTATPVSATADDDDDDHGDHGEGPHGGTIIELDRYHGEFVVDHDKKQATVYILDGSAKKTVAVPAETMTLSITEPKFTVELKAAPEASDPKGNTSRFVGTNDNLGKVQEFQGTVTVEIKGKPYTGEFEEEHHDDE